jgi:hypothetical protein
MDIAEYCRKGFSPLKYKPDLVITPNELSWNSRVIKKMETFNIYVNK